MALQNNHRSTSVDIAKYIASLLIIAIHTSLFSDVSETLSFAVVNIVCRAAVPFFAVCSGYFLVKRLDFHNVLVKSKQNQKIFAKQWKKMVLLYGVWSALYMLYSIPMWIKTGWFSPMAFVDYAIGALTKGSHYQFWCLWGMIYSLPVFYLVLRLTPRKFWDGIICVLWLIKAATYGYATWLPASLMKAVEFAQHTGALLALLPLLLLGAKIATGKEHSLRFGAIGVLASAVGLCVEAFGLKSAGQEAVSYIFFTLPLSYFLFQTLLKIKLPRISTSAKTLGTVSVFVYCVHPMLVETTMDLFPKSIFHFAFVAIMSTFLGLVYLFVQKKISRKKVNLCSN